MRILFSANAFPHESNQFAAFIKVICEEFIRQGHEVTVIAPQSVSRVLLHSDKILPYSTKYEVNTEMGVGYIKVIRPYSFSTGYGRLLKYTYKFNKLAFERVAKRLVNEFDIIYAHFWTSAYNAVDIAIKYKIPLYVTTGEDQIQIGKVLLNEEVNKLRQSIHGVICVSTKNKDESFRLGLTDLRNSIVIPNAISQNEFFLKDKLECRRNLGFPEDTFIVSYCGRFIERKGVKRVSDAIKILNDPKVKSIFIGQNVQNQKVQPDCEGILYKGPLPHNQIVNYLNAADVFVLPTLAEGCSNSIIEAMACGLPIISSDLPFNYDILNEDNAILVDPMNVEEIASAIKRIKDDKDLYKRMSNASLQKASEMTIEKRVNKILEFINQKKCSKK